MICQTIPLSDTNPQVTLSTYVLDDSLQYATGVQRPAALVLPGGGYTNTSDREAEFVALEFAAMGYHAFVLRYSVGESARMPTPILEGFAAIALIRERAGEWNIDPKRVFVCGFSAGGHLAAGLMTMWKDSRITTTLGCPAEALRPDAGILCYALLRLPYLLPPTDTGIPVRHRTELEKNLSSEFWQPQHPDWRDAIFERDGTLWVDSAKISYLNCFGTAAPTEEQCKQYCMDTKVDEDTPPVFLWATTPDETVPASHSVAFANAMLEKGRQVELHLFGSGGHGLSLAKATTDAEVEDWQPATRWLKLARTWLERVLKSPEAMPGSPFASGREPSGKNDLPAADADEKPPSYYSNIYHDRAGMFCHSPFSLEQLLIRHVIEGDEKAALDTLGSIGNQGSKAVLAKDPLRSAKNSIICSCTFLTRAAIQAGVSDEEAFALSDAAIQHIETLTNIKEVLGYETAMLLQVIRLVKKNNGKHYSAPVRRALYYVESHLEEVIQLKNVAEYAKVHPNYLSKRFKEETGTTISAYTAARKLHEAAYFVQHTDYPMAEIASLYAFSSQSYFISSFKKLMGMPPGEYRNR